MKHKKIIITIILCIVIPLVFIVYGYMIFLLDLSKKCASSGTVSALNAALAGQMDRDANDFAALFPSGDTEWHILSTDNYDKVIRILSKSYNLDPPKHWDKSSVLLDFWKNRFVISYRKLDTGEYDFIAASKGKDGILNTKDDIIRGGNDKIPLGNYDE